MHAQYSWSGLCHEHSRLESKQWHQRLATKTCAAGSWQKCDTWNRQLIVSNDALMNFRYIVNRIVHSAVLLVLVTIVVFLILHIAPGDPATILLGGQGTPEDIRHLRAVLGLNRPLWDQYLNYADHLAHGDLGISIRLQRPVLDYVGPRIPASLELLATALLISLIIAVPSGVLAAVRHRSPTDYWIMGASIAAQSIPSFWLGLMLIILFAVKMRVLPASGSGGISHLVLPAVTLAAYEIGLVSRFIRSGMLEVLSADYVRTARAKGLRESTVLVRHALRNAILPLVTVLGVQAGTLFGGAVITEAVFAWPGIGSLAVDAIYQRDYPVVQGVVLLFAMTFVFIDFIIDIAYLLVDPRVSYQ